MIYTAAEAEYNAAFNDYMSARAGFYAGKVSAQEFINLRNAMEAALAAWEAERESA
jgi:multidrug resistance efflux pump